jgi:hypothetical protein
MFESWSKTRFLKRITDKLRKCENEMEQIQILTKKSNIYFLDNFLYDLVNPNRYGERGNHYILV